MISQKTYRATLRHFLAPVAKYLDDDEVREIMINGCEQLYIERAGRLVMKKPCPAFTNHGLRAAVINIAQFMGLQLGPEVVRFDARLPEGHRVHVVLPPVSRCGVSVTIRKHSGQSLTMDDLAGRLGSLTGEARVFLDMCVAEARNIIVSGGTGTGKTTFLNALSAAIPDEQRILVLEDASELQLQKPHVVALETRLADRKGVGAVSIRDLLHSALRMRPDRILVGECRGGEALDMLQAMNTGHPGSMSTVHADSASAALERLEVLALFAGFEIPIRFLRAQIASAVHILVQLQRLGGRRIVQSIVAVDGLDDRGGYKIRQLFEFDGSRGTLERISDAQGREHQS